MNVTLLCTKTFNPISTYSAINKYHAITTIKCFHSDNSYERESGTLINGIPVPDYYDIECFNFKGILINRYHFTNKDEANKCYKNLQRRIG